MSALTDSQLNTLRSQLNRLRAELEQQLEIGASATDVVKLDQTLVGRVSRVDALQQQSMALTTRRKIETRLARVKHALSKFEAGDFGYCQRCDEEIGIDRLQAQPESALCLRCQDRSDRL